MCVMCSRVISFISSLDVRCLNTLWMRRKIFPQCATFKISKIYVKPLYIRCLNMLWMRRKISPQRSTFKITKIYIKPLYILGCILYGCIWIFGHGNEKRYVVLFIIFQTEQFIYCAVVQVYTEMRKGYLPWADLIIMKCFIFFNGIMPSLYPIN